MMDKKEDSTDLTRSNWASGSLSRCENFWFEA
jgi:hypothetical protein